MVDDNFYLSIQIILTGDQFQFESFSVVVDRCLGRVLTVVSWYNDLCVCLRRLQSEIGPEINGSEGSHHTV